jgi:enterochelin esterase-like enzyme
MQRLKMSARWGAGLAMVSLIMAMPVHAAEAVIKEKIKVPSVSLESNLEGNTADRDVIVILPASYATNPTKRYPVVYFLHGFYFNVEWYESAGKFVEAMAEVNAKGPEVILVLPDSYTRHAGAMYSNSVTVGNFEGFIARDLVAHVDGRYRTIARPAARGLGGHSMGGYGTWKIAMKYPGIFSTLYGMSSCCLMPNPMSAEQGRKIEALSMEQALKADFGTRAMLASAAAWSPNPGNAPLYFDWLTQDGVTQPTVLAQWYANAPNAMLAQYVPALKSYSAIGIEIGTQDVLIGNNKIFDEELTRFGILHSYETYDGGHSDKFAERVKNHMLPFFQGALAEE